MHDRKDDVRDVGLEALGNKASQPRERCPRGQRRRCFAQTVQAWMDSREKTAREGTPEPKNEKSIANRRQNNKQSPFVSRFHRHRSLYEMTEELTIQTVYKDRKLNSHSSRKTSRSLLLRKERLNSEDRGGICSTVQ